MIIAPQRKTPLRSILCESDPLSSAFRAPECVLFRLDDGRGCDRSSASNYIMMKTGEKEMESERARGFMGSGIRNFLFALSLYDGAYLPSSSVAAPHGPQSR